MFRFGAAVAAVVCLATSAQAQTLTHFLRDFRPTDTTTMRVSAFLDGALRDAANAESEATASGSVGLRFGLSRWVVQSDITINSGDTIASGFGANILTPNLGGSGRSATVEAALPLGLPALEGATAYVTLAQSDWMASVDDAQVVATANLVGVGVMLYDHITGVRPQDRQRAGAGQDQDEVGMAWGLGLSYRGVFGDIDRAFRVAALGERDDSYLGAEAYMALTVNQITPFVRTYWYPTFLGNKEDVPGLTGFNAVFGVSLRGAFFTGDFERDADSR